uniref:Acyl-coenzyme A thioesterase 13 n=1 Tax=Kalanchoe fedtschenkoi TaxID=63787 RepID=A0A7N0V2W3_KALFE
MDLEAVKRLLEGDSESQQAVDSLPLRFFDQFMLGGMKVDKLEPGRLICSMKVPARLVSGGGFLQGGATATMVDLVGSLAMFTTGVTVAGVSVEINLSYLDAAFEGEEVEIEARVLRVGKAVGVVSVEIRKKRTGKIVAQGRHTLYLAVASKL